MATHAKKHRRLQHGSAGGGGLFRELGGRFVAAIVLAFVGLMIFVRVVVVVDDRTTTTTAVKSSSSSRDPTSSEQRLFNDPNEIPMTILEHLDAVIVLGGGSPSSLEEPPIFVQKRADDAANVVQRRQTLHDQPKRPPQKQRELKTKSSSLPILCLSAGTAHVPQLLSPDGFPIWESTSTAAYLAKQHHLTEDVYVETSSYDTIGNAFFTRTSHTDINGWRNLLIITSEFHMSRTAAIFDWIFVSCSSSSSTSSSSSAAGGSRRQDRRHHGKDGSDGGGYNLYYLSSPNVGLSSEVIEARRQREEESAKNIRDHLTKQYTTLADVWAFLTREHSLYTASSLIDRSRGSVKDAMASDVIKRSYGLYGLHDQDR